MKKVTRRQFLQTAAGGKGHGAGKECFPERTGRCCLCAGAPDHRSMVRRLGILYCHEGDWSWIYFFNGQCTDTTGTPLWQWLGQQKR